MKLPPMPRTTVLVSYAGAVVVGLCLGWALWHPKPAPVETPAPQIIQRDSSLVLQRAPDAHAKPGMIVPNGGTVERIVHLTVQAHPETTAPHAPVSTISGTTMPLPATIPRLPAPTGDSVTITCPPVQIDLVLVRLADGTHRVIAKSPNGAILSGVDIPVTNVAVPRSLAWSAGPVYNIGSRGWGGAVTRDLGPFRLMGAVTQQQGGGAAVLVGAMVRF